VKTGRSLCRIAVKKLDAHQFQTFVHGECLLIYGKHGKQIALKLFLFSGCQMADGGLVLSSYNQVQFIVYKIIYPTIPQQKFQAVYAAK
jgi:hypothetical protein